MFTNAIARLMFAILTVAAALAFGSAAQAQVQGRVGVTQATENNPLGKPPTGTERVLKGGTDIQANESVTTGGNDRAHLIFLDGTTVTIGPNSKLTIDKFVYDPNTEKGDLSMSTSAGVLRVIGG